MLSIEEGGGPAVADVRLNLEGDDGQISVEVLHAALGDLLALLAEAAEAIDLDEQDWHINELIAASAHVAMSAPQGDSVATFVRRGLKSLTDSPAIPDLWTRQMVKRVRSLGRRAGTGGTTEVSLGLGGPSTLVLTPRIIDHAHRALGTATASHGSIRGYVDRWNEHGKREIGVSRDQQAPVPVKYPAELSERVRREAVGHDIQAWGILRRNVMGQLVGMTLENFTVLDPLDEIPVRSLRGVFRMGPTPISLDEWLEDRHAR